MHNLLAAAPKTAARAGDSFPSAFASYKVVAACCAPAWAVRSIRGLDAWDSAGLSRVRRRNGSELAARDHAKRRPGLKPLQSTRFLCYRHPSGGEAR